VRNPDGICFVGAMNHDIVSRSRMPSDVRTLLLSRHNANSVDFSETAISDEDSERILDRLKDVKYRSELGGSGFNAIRSATLLGSNVRLGFVGVVGHINNAYPHIDFLYSQNVEIPFLRQEQSPCARSISFSFDGDRTLLTALGANTRAAEFFISLNSLVSNYLLSFSTIHVTSFLDSRTIDSLGKILQSG
jgi:ribokinase